MTTGTTTRRLMDRRDSSGRSRRWSWLAVACEISVDAYLLTFLLTGARHHISARADTDKIFCRCFGAPACRVFPDHLITFLSPEAAAR